jgi:DNA (cytosine-5)-methyltransferase 1
MDDMMRAIELFSGAGGLALGLERAGFQSAALFERDADACETLRHNRPKWRIVQSDVRDVRYSDYGPVDLVAGGPPCQPFSMGGKARGFDDHRDMFPEAVRAVRELQPLAFIFENVRGLLRPCFRNYVEYVRLQLSRPAFENHPNATWDANLRRLEKFHTSREAESTPSYKVTINLADAADYGVPQRRHRVFFVGFRSDLDVKWFFPGPTHGAEALRRTQEVTGAYWLEHDLPAPITRSAEVQPDLLSGRVRWQTVRDAIRGLGDPRAPSPFKNHVYQGGARTYPGHTGSPLDQPAKALKAGDHGVPGGENMLRHPNGAVRYFTIRESARVQTFPDDYEFVGSWTESMRQLGNAVPVELARVVAHSVSESLKSHARRNRLQPA